MLSPENQRELLQKSKGATVSTNFLYRDTIKKTKGSFLVMENSIHFHSKARNFFSGFIFPLNSFHPLIINVNDDKFITTNATSRTEWKLSQCWTPYYTNHL